MAIWQYTFEIIPKEILSELGVSNFISPDDYEKCDFECEMDLVEALVADMMRGESWSEEIIVYGDAESTCIKFFIENEKVTGIIARLDIRYDCSIILNSIVQFCSLRAFAILDEDKILDLNATSIIEHIKESNQLMLYRKLLG